MGCAQSTPLSSNSRLFRQVFGTSSQEEEEDDDDERRRTRGASSSSRGQRRAVQEEQRDEILKTKVVLLGDSGVGKSCIVNRFATNTFDVDSRVTVGAAFVARTIEVNKSNDDERLIKIKKPPQVTARRVKFEIWDTAGQERYESLANLYYRRAHVAIVVFALDDEKSFEKARFWINELKEKCEKRDALIILCGNKMDKITDEHEDRIEEPSSSSAAATLKSRGGNGGDEIVEDDDGNAVFVSMDRANRMANELGCHMCVTSSAKTGEGVEELFFEVARTLLRKQRNGGGKLEATNDGGATTTKKMKTKKAKKKTRSNTTSTRNDAEEEEEGEEGGENDGDANTAALTAREFGADAKTKKKKKKKTTRGETSTPSRRPLRDA